MIPRRPLVFLLIVPFLLVACEGPAEPPEAREEPEGTDAEAAVPAEAVPAWDERRKTDFLPLDLPEGILFDRPERTEEWPWILVADDLQCPYCVQLGLGLAKAREMGDEEISRAVEAIVLFPLSFHDQAAHASADIVCFEQTRERHPWDGMTYMKYLLAEPYLSDPGWPGATIADLWEPGGWWMGLWPEKKMTASRRTDFLHQVATNQTACDWEACAGDPQCLELCEETATCVKSCGEEFGEIPEAKTCAVQCQVDFIKLRFRQLSRLIQDCLLERDGHDPHQVVAGTESWCREQGIPGTPTVLVGHPRIGFRLLGDSDDLDLALETIGKALAEVRQLLEAS
jgi:hypothetical protein